MIIWKCYISMLLQANANLAKKHSCKRIEKFCEFKTHFWGECIVFPQKTLLTKLFFCRCFAFTLVMEEKLFQLFCKQMQSFSGKCNPFARECKFYKRTQSFLGKHKVLYYCICSQTQVFFLHHQFLRGERSLHSLAKLNWNWLWKKNQCRCKQMQSLSGKRNNFAREHKPFAIEPKVSKGNANVFVRNSVFVSKSTEIPSLCPLGSIEFFWTY